MPLSPQLIWFLIGVAFLIGEMALPGFILIFFTAGSWIAALVTLTTNISLTGQIIVFVVSSLMALFALRKYSLKTFRGKASDDVDDRYKDAKIGKTAQVTKAITPHIAGEIKVMGSFWRAIADEEIAEGSAVIVDSQVSEDGLTLKVKPL